MIMKCSKCNEESKVTMIQRTIDYKNKVDVVASKCSICNSEYPAYYLNNRAKKLQNLISNTVNVEKRDTYRKELQKEMNSLKRKYIRN